MTPIWTNFPRSLDHSFQTRVCSTFPYTAAKNAAMVLPSVKQLTPCRFQVVLAETTEEAEFQSSVIHS